MSPGTPHLVVGDDELLVENAFINRAASWSDDGGLVMMQVHDNDAEIWIRPTASAPYRYPASRVGALSRPPPATSRRTNAKNTTPKSATGTPKRLPYVLR